MATNPAVSLPRADAIRTALANLDLLVVSEVVASNDTIADTIAPGPHVLLPAAAWGEKDGTVTNSERRISRQRSFLEPPGEAKPDWWIVCQTAKRMGFAKEFDFAYPADIFREHARLSAFENDGRAISTKGPADVSPDGYRTWRPCNGLCAMGRDGQARLFATPLFRARRARVLRHVAFELDRSPRRTTLTCSTPDGCAITGTP
jgi:assimilatory nitrate reductase catalytic subunit